MNISELEIKFIEQNIQVAGIDEVGRGPLAGPVVAGIVLLNKEHNTLEINDSKLISEKKRLSIYYQLIENYRYSVHFVDNIIVDEINILQATFKAMTMCVEIFRDSLDHLLIDGNRFVNVGIPYTTVVKGDRTHYSIAAASIIAKVTRDKWMEEIADKQYPEYNFKQNKGYGTKEHFLAIEKYGICPIHRKTFLKNIFQNKKLQLF